MARINSQTMKDHNVRLLLNTLRKNGPLSRSALAKQMDLTSAAITNIVSALLQKQMLREIGQTEAPSGRRPVLLDLNPSACYVLGMVMTAEAVTVVLTDYQAHIVHREHRPISPLLGKPVILDLLVACARSCLQQSGVEPARVLAMGIATPGPMNVQEGVLLNPPNFKDWVQVPICQIMEDALGVPCVLDKETNAAALAEYYFGTPEEYRTAFYLTLLQTGIGGSVMLGGKVIHGFCDGAGEIGHMQVDPHGPRCSCGRFGCLESIACGDAMLTQAKAKLRSLSAFRSQLPCTPETLTLEQLFTFSDQHHPLFEEIVDHAAQMIAAAIGNVILLLSPSLVVIGGSLPLINPGFVDRIAAFIHAMPYPHSIRSVKVVPSTLGSNGCAMGAAMLALEAFQTSL